MRCFGHFSQGVVCVLCSSKSGGEMIKRLVVVCADAVFHQFADAVECCFVLRVTSLLPAVASLSTFLYKLLYFVWICRPLIVVS